MPENKIKFSVDRRVIEQGGFYFGDDEDDIYTLLGSCVAVTLWHPTLKLAGMCHILLPERGQDKSSTRFADCAVKKFLEMIHSNKTKPHQYEVGVYGGGNMFPLINKSNKELLGTRNVNKMESLLILEGFRVKYKDAGGEVARKLILNRHTGSITLEHVKIERM